MGVFLNGDAITEPDPRGERVRDETFLLLFSADSQPAWFTLPAEDFGHGWEVVLDTGAAGPSEGARSPSAISGNGLPHPALPGSEAAVAAPARTPGAPGPVHGDAGGPVHDGAGGGSTTPARPVSRPVRPVPCS